jgi:hypothetical protein
MLTKQILLARRALKKAEEKQTDELPALEKAIYQLRRDVELAQTTLYNALEQNGQCGECAMPKDKCEGHYGMAGSAGDSK